jgi:hypothetical protein
MDWGAMLCGVIGLALLYRLAMQQPVPLSIVAVFVLIAAVVRPKAYRQPAVENLAVRVANNKGL